jgi:cellulose synthase/poly-beta-1,6-N-acetylglucosamine synthase-like glycosyltransferase
VDSGSTDGSVERARELGAEVVELDTSIPFTAARARNAGAARLRERRPGLDAIQFLDGDCELDAGWVAAAWRELTSAPEIAVVCGRRREKEPDATIWNALIDLEWDTPVGEAAACGGDALFDAERFHAVGGFDDAVIAGEEPELCFRIRRAGGRVRRIDHEMTRHDAAITRLGQAWKRNVRGGHACAEGVWMHGRSPERYNVRSLVRIVGWAAGTPLVFVGLLAAAAVAGGQARTGLLIGALAVPALWLLQIVRLSIQQTRRAGSVRVGVVAGTWLMAGKFAELVGVATFLLRRLRGQRGTIIEYKGAQPEPGS